MKSGAHALGSLGVAAAALVVTAPPVPAWMVVAVALLAGVGVDLDHFLIARYNAGDWRALCRCLRDPGIALFEQDAIFADRTGDGVEVGDDSDGRQAVEVDALERLVTHLVITGGAVALLWIPSPYLAGLVAATLYVHVLADVVSTARNAVVLDAGAAPGCRAAETGSEREGDTSD